MSKEFPSFNTDHREPHCWIRWKGTDVCADFRCKCGFSGHYDEEFAYYIQCPECNQIYECDGHIKLHELDFDPGNVIVVE